MSFSNPLLVELQWVHSCFCIDSVNKINEGRISLISPLATGKKIVTGLYEIESLDSPKQFANIISKHSSVKNVKIVDQKGNKALVYAQVIPDSLFIEGIGKTGCVPIEPSLTFDGVDSCAVYAPTQTHLKNLRSMLKDNFEVKILSKKELNPTKAKSTAYLGLKELLEFKSLSARLTPQQFEVLTLASKKGYFESPKKTSLNEIASFLGLKQATASEHLRKAQNKIMPFVAQTLQNLRC